MTEPNQFSPKIYRRMLTRIYLQNRKDAQTIKDKWANFGSPIVQKENRLFSPRTRRFFLTQEYYKKMAEKTEKPHIRRIPMESSFGSGPIVVKENKKKISIKLNPKIRKNQTSMYSTKLEKNHKKFSENSYLKNFFLDDFNSIKKNQYDIDIRKNVSIKNNNINNLLILEKISK